MIRSNLTLARVFNCILFNLLIPYLTLYFLCFLFFCREFQSCLGECLSHKTGNTVERQPLCFSNVIFQHVQLLNQKVFFNWTNYTFLLVVLLICQITFHAELNHYLFMCIGRVLTYQTSQPFVVRRFYYFLPSFGSPPPPSLDPFSFLNVCSCSKRLSKWISRFVLFQSWVNDHSTCTLIVKLKSAFTSWLISEQARRDERFWLYALEALWFDHLA